MTHKLVIVESPTKARTVGRFLGQGYTVRASVGHIRDLPQNRLGVDVDRDFTPHYVIPARKKDVVKSLQEAVHRADEVYLATDPDREGEAISWHLHETLKLSRPKRVVFHEITQDAIAQAFAHPRGIDMQLVESQQARRILDRLVGYSLSPLLRDKMGRRGLSAGRVQSVALRLIVEREREIAAFVPVEYWSIEANLAKREPRQPPRSFRARLLEIRGAKFEIHTGAEAQQLVAELQHAGYVVGEVRRGERRRSPAAPFTTSTMQQEASRKLGFDARRTMRVAQQLYEGVDLGDETGPVGLITYMRTDSVALAETAVAEIRAYIAQTYGPEYVPPTPPVYKTRAVKAQEAHEAIRPTSVRRTPETIKEHLTSEQFRLYRLIWQRTVASQMTPAMLDTVSVDVWAGPPGEPERPYLFRATGARVKFKGFMAVYIEGRDDDAPPDDEDGKWLPPLEPGEPLDLVALIPEQHFTEPPPRYTDATLVRTLEDYGIGRPSTYAPIISILQDRYYVTRDNRRFIPTEIGLIVCDLLLAHFPGIMDYGFTAQMEELLDEIAAGERQWVPVLRQFWEPFSQTLQLAQEQMAPVVIADQATDEVCPQCGQPLALKVGRYGRFYGCTGFPACRFTKGFSPKIGVQCPQCGGDIVERTTRKKRTFYGCSNYPACEWTSWKRPLPTKCPSCGGMLVEDGQKGFSCLACKTTFETLPGSKGAREQRSKGAGEQRSRGTREQKDQQGRSEVGEAGMAQPTGDAR